MTSTKSIRSRVFLLVMLPAIFLIPLFLPGCRQADPPLPRLRIGHAPHDHHSPLYIAALNPDYFRKNGGIYLREHDFRKRYDLVGPNGPLAEIIIQQSTGGQEIIRRLAEHHFDLVFGGVPAILHHIDQGKKLRIVAPIMTEGAGLFVGNQIPADNWGEFSAYVKQNEQPVRIGYKFEVSVQNIIFQEALRESGIRFSQNLDDAGADIILINLFGANNLIPAMEQGLIEGFVVMQPFLALAENKNLGKVIALLKDLPPQGQWAGIPCCALAADDAYVEQNPEIVSALISLLLRANEFLSDQPVETSARMVSRWLDIPSGVEELSLPTIQFAAGFDAAWERNMDHWVQVMIEQGLLRETVRRAYETDTLNGTIYHPDFSRKAEDRLQ